MTLSACGDDDESTEHGNERTEKAVNADNLFWDFIHGKDYQSFNTVLEKLGSAQAEDPLDVYTNAHIGWTNFWAFSEGIGSGIAEQTMALQYMQNAEKAFTQASELAPNEPRILGFLGYSRMALGYATQNEELLIKGQADVARSVELWPEWAYFGAAYGLDASAPYDSPQFEQAVNFYWANLDVCANTDVDRQYPDWTAYLDQETLDGPDRACWDSWIAPYNTEGFFLIMGDALVKAGNTQVASIVYNNAKLLKYYSSWPFRDLLEQRLNNIMENVENFRQIVSPNQPADPETSLLVNTTISCAICHRGDADAHYAPPAWVGETANEYLGSL
jgi:hypothetical protein